MLGPLPEVRVQVAGWFIVIKKVGELNRDEIEKRTCCVCGSRIGKVGRRNRCRFFLQMREQRGLLFRCNVMERLPVGFFPSRPAWAPIELELIVSFCGLV